jgi:hypothetical protein
MNRFSFPAILLSNLKKLSAVAAVAVSALAITSCHKSNAVSVANPAFLQVIDASADATGLDFYVNSTKENINAIVYGGGLYYLTVNAGTSQISFNQTGTATKVASGTGNLSLNHYYTVFLSNHAATPDVTFLPDSIIQTIPSGDCLIRFVNMSPDAGVVDFGIKGQTKTFSGAGYKSASIYGPMAANTVADTLQVYQGGTTNVLASIPTLTLSAGGIYTVWLSGFAGGTGTTALKANIVASGYSQTSTY